MKRVAIVGFGLIGGSLSLALRRGGNVHVTAIDRAPVLERPEAQAAADEHLPLEQAEALREALERSDVTVLAVPVGTIVRLLPWSLTHARVVTDCGSTKRDIAHAAAEHARGAFFVPGHPMAGLPDGGIENARADLFEGRAWIVSPDRAEPTAFQAVRELLALTGAHLVELSPDAHDRAVAFTSHLPQLLASALLTLADEQSARPAMGPAFERATRAADEVARAVEALCKELGEVAVALRRSPPDTQAALALLARARSRRG
jgi:prephenate dehydrogenase